MRIISDGVISKLGQIQDPAVAEALRLLGDIIQEITAQDRGTLQPDQRPSGLAFGDAGLEFFSIDFNRLYIWGGTAWEDAPRSPVRFLIALFPQENTPEPSTGWARCDGTRITRSTSDGRTADYLVPLLDDIEGMRFWTRL